MYTIMYKPKTDKQMKRLVLNVVIQNLSLIAWLSYSVIGSVYDTNYRLINQLYGVVRISIISFII